MVSPNEKIACISSQGCVILIPIKHAPEIYSLICTYCCVELKVTDTPQVVWCGHRWTDMDYEIQLYGCMAVHIQLQVRNVVGAAIRVLNQLENVVSVHAHIGL